jgi:hypothetical protein
VPVLEEALAQHLVFNLLTSELNPSAQRCLPRFLPGILIFKGLRLYKSFGEKRVKSTVLECCSTRQATFNEVGFTLFTDHEGPQGE